MSLFFKNHGPFDINNIIKNTVYSEKKKIDKILVKNISILSKATKHDISFFDSIKYKKDLDKTNAAFLFIKKKDLIYLGKNKNTYPLISENPLLDFILTAKLFYPDADHDNIENANFSINAEYIKFNTFVHKTVKLGENFMVGMNTTIKKNVTIGKNVSIGSNCVISNSVIDDNVIINDGTIIGKIGYGFKYINKNFHFIPHIGCVKISKNVYIGANCTIDRGSFTNTVIGENTKIDNQAHIAHNVEIGSNCYLAAQVGIAGSSKIGDNCMVGGQSGVSGHIKIGNNVKIGGKSGVLRDVSSNSSIMGYPSRSIKSFLKDYK